MPNFLPAPSITIVDTLELAKLIRNIRSCVAKTNRIFLRNCAKQKIGHIPMPNILPALAGSYSFAATGYFYEIAGSFLLCNSRPGWGYA